jgi:pyruvate dehydrogenase E2 component (dihydrolipoamide acetyltransferase)
MLREILLPQLGQTMEEGTIEAWRKSEGDQVRKGDVLYDLTTDKATLEVESFVDGVLLKILVPAGQTAPVNELVAICGEEGDKLPEDLAAYRAQVLASLGVEGAPAAPAGAPAQAPAAAAAEAQAAAPAAAAGPVLSSPRARKVAGELKVPIAVVRGSGPGGRIIERDVLAHAEKLSQIKCTPAAREAAFEAGIDLLAVRPREAGGRIAKEDVAAAAAAPVRRPAAAPGERIPLTAMRNTIARRMTQIKQTVPHFYLFSEILMRRAMKRREELNAAGGPRITVTHLLIRALALALKQHPRVNAQFAGDAVALNPAVNVGVAVAVEDGLFVPVIRNADARSLAEIATELKALTQTATEGKLRPDQYEGGSITISNLGMFGVDAFVPIINSPEACILGIGRIKEEIVVQEGAMRVEPLMTATLSADHRVVDGAQAARFLQSFREMLEAPEGL